jgi:hypothetical protein
MVSTKAEQMVSTKAEQTVSTKAVPKGELSVQQKEIRRAVSKGGKMVE